MRTGLSIFIIMIILGMAIGISIPIAHAQTEPPTGITFHVHPNGSSLGSQNLLTIPADTQDKILIAGTSTTTRTRAALENLCSSESTGTPTPSPSPTPTGTPSVPCAAIDLYFQITWTLAWNSGLEAGCGTFGVCDRNVAPLITIQYGGSANPITASWGNCGPAAVATGSCTNTLSGTILAADIENQDIGSAAFLNEFFDVSYSEYWGGSTFQTSYSIILSTSPILENCAGQFNIGATLGSFTLAATNSTGVDLKTTLGMSYPGPGQWYVVQVSGSWQNNGTGSTLRDVGHKVGVSGYWFPLVASPDVKCADSNNDTYYLQMISNDAVYMRVFDTDGNFASNSGSLTITISGVTAYTPYESGCELEYQVGDLIEQRSVDASQDRGHPLMNTLKYGTGGEAYETQPMRFYMLETIGGPANLGEGVLTWGADLGIREHEADLVPSNWYEIHTAPFVTCVKQTDIVGHVKVFFAADSQATLKGAITDYFYAMRVRDTGSYSDNSGTLSYRLYEATNMQMTLPGATVGPNGCNRFSHETTPVDSVVIQATTSVGISLPSLASLSLYALQVTGGPWQDGGVNPSYSVELSDDNGASWLDLEDYPQLLCAASTDGNHIIIYIYGAAGKHWKARVNDTDNAFGSNTGSIGIDVFAGLTSINEYPNCSQTYTLTKVPLSDEERTIPGNMEAGKDIPASSLTGSSNVLAIEITDESKWYETGTGNGSYLVDITDDGGATWKALEDYTSLCSEQIGNGDRYRIVFDVGVVGGERVDPGAPNNRKLRVRDTDGNFLSNTGYVMYQLYKAVATNPDTTPPGGTTTPAPAEWVVACNENYSRPGGFIASHYIGTIAGISISIPVPMVGEWIDYLRNAITFYFAWCPQHTAMLRSIGDVAMDKEPMATIVDMVNFMKSIKALLESYQAIGGESTDITSQEPNLFSDTANIGNAMGGGSSPEAPIAHGAGAWDLFVTGTFDPIKNVWFGGKVDLTTALNNPYNSETDAYVGICTEKFNSLWGIFTITFCGVMGMMRYSHIMNWLLLALDLFVSIWFILKYIPGYCKKTIALLTGNKGAITRLAH
jgi:hypothetical protein